MAAKKKHRQNKPHGHFCKVCGDHKPNEKFSGKGHTAHICRKCAALPVAKRNEMMELRRIMPKAREDDGDKYFDDKAMIPTDNMVDDAIADTKGLWDKLSFHVAENYQGISHEWKMYSKKSGWNLVFKQGKRTLFYFVPCESYFIIAFVLGEKAVNTAIQSSLSAGTKEAISDADVCAMGHSFFVTVKGEQDIEDVIALLKIKAAS